GGKSNQAIKTDISLSCGTISEVDAAMKVAMSKGFDILKIKLGSNVQDDIKLCQHIKSTFPPEIVLRLDANQGWSVKETLKFIEVIHPLDLNIELIEQPVAEQNIKGMAEITKNSPYAIMADESVFSYTDALNVLENKAANIINIKLAKSGGITNAFKILEASKKYNTECMIGCMMESPLGIAAAAHFAVATGINKIDLDPLDWVDTKYFSRWLDFFAPKIKLNYQIGMGYIPIVI
ncbi:MAG: L-alanine-DL-glutamate epimerase-like enolase superfamily enzyme, partial [Francisellaceae bacterium]